MNVHILIESLVFMKNVIIFFIGKYLIFVGKKNFSIKVWKIFNECFKYLPVAALINSKIFCIHGGLSPDLENFEQIKNLERPYDDPQKGLLCDLIWSDPLEEHDGWEESRRGISFQFGADIVSNFREKNNLSLIVSSLQVILILEY